MNDNATSKRRGAPYRGGPGATVPVYLNRERQQKLAALLEWNDEDSPSHIVGKALDFYHTARAAEIRQALSERDDDHV